VFSEEISTRIKVRPEFVKAMDFARTIKKAVPHQRVILTVHEMKRLGRGAAELLAIAEDLRHHDIDLDLRTGPLQGVYDPSGHGAALFAFFAGMAESEREYIREKSPRRPGIRPRTRPTRRQAQGRRRRHGRLRPVLADQRCPRPADRAEARHHLGQEQGRTPVGRHRHRFLAAVQFHGDRRHS
jgi:DNA invertase Pin-like site-specific DNA recombinase